MPTAEPYAHPALAYSVQDMSTWLSRPIEVAGRLRRHVYSKLVLPLESVSDEAVAMTHKYDHIINDAQLEKARPVTPLVEWSGRNALSDMCVRVWNSVANANACCFELGSGRNCGGGCALERNCFIVHEGVQCGDADCDRHCAPQ